MTIRTVASGTLRPVQRFQPVEQFAQRVVVSGLLEELSGPRGARIKHRLEVHDTAQKGHDARLVVTHIHRAEHSERRIVLGRPLLVICSSNNDRRSEAVVVSRA